MSRIYYQLRSSKTRGPDVATGISRSIFMSCHDNARGVMFDSDLESRADLIKWKGTAYTPNVTYIQQMSYIYIYMTYIIDRQLYIILRWYRWKCQGSYQYSSAGLILVRYVRHLMAPATDPLLIKQSQKIEYVGIVHFTTGNSLIYVGSERSFWVAWACWLLCRAVQGRHIYLVVIFMYRQKITERSDLDGVPRVWWFKMRISPVKAVEAVPMDTSPIPSDP